MAIKKAVSNPTLAPRKPISDAFPVRHVLGLLQQNERLSECPAQSAPQSPKEIVNEHQENHHINTQNSSKYEDVVTETSPSQAKNDSQESHSSKGEDAEDKIESKTCYKCGKTFASWQGLRGHLNRVKPCDQEKTVSRRRPAASKTCSKCGRTFSSPQSLRIHMNRVRPCDQDPKSAADPTALSDTTSTSPTTLVLASPEEVTKEAGRKAKARYKARKAYLKKRGRLDELGDPPTAHLSGDELSYAEKTEQTLNHKRNALDGPSQEGGDVEMSSDGVKRPRVQEGTVQKDESADSPSDVSGLTQLSSLTIPQRTTEKKVSTVEGSFVHRSKKVHGGDLLAGGCSCPPCVRRWARKLMNRMQQLEDEVLMLRQKQCTGADATSAASTKLDVGFKATQDKSESLLLLASSTSGQSHSAASVVGNSQTKEADDIKSPVGSSHATATSQPPKSSVASTKPSVSLTSDGQSLYIKTSSDDLQRIDDDNQRQCVDVYVLQGADSDMKRLMDAYQHMNDQILLNERAVEESSVHVQILVGINPTTAMDFRKQIDELRASIAAEKSKRDVTVAALIAHVWKPRCDEFKELFGTEAQNSPRDEQAYHTKWADITTQMSMKDELILELERRMEALRESSGHSRSRYSEMGEMSSKMAAECAAKMALESEREGIYVGLVKSNARIRSLVGNALFSSYPGLPG